MMKQVPIPLVILALHSFSVFLNEVLEPSPVTGVEKPEESILVVEWLALGGPGWSNCS